MMNDSFLTEKDLAIYWLIGDNLLITTAPLANCIHNDTFYDLPLDHIGVWEFIRKKYKNLDAQYEYYPRGRMTFNEKTNAFILFGDQQIISNKLACSAICKKCHLKKQDNVIISADTHYQSSYHPKTPSQKIKIINFVFKK